MLSWRVHTGGGFSPPSSSYTYHNHSPCRLFNITFTGGSAAATRTRSRKSPNFSTNSALRFEEKQSVLVDGDVVVKEKKKKKKVDDDEEDEVSGIQVPREGYIPVSKADLLDAIVFTMFRSSKQQEDDPENNMPEEVEEEEEEEVGQFLLLSSCLDSILHAEHKTILEQMRIDYHSNQDDKEEEEESDSSETENSEPDSPIMPFTDNYGFDFKKLLLGSSTKYKKGEKYSSSSRVALATRFQRAFMKLLSDAQFEELSARDLMLTSALNTDYLLTLPVYVDWKKASEANAIIFRRGYAIERQKGLLIVEKLDYIQSKILQGIFFLISKPLGKVGIWITEALKNAFQTQEVRIWTERMKLWIKELSLIQQSSSYDEENSDNMLGVDQISNSDLPMWLAAQRAVPRYEDLLSSVGPRERLLRKLLMWTGLITPKPKTPFEIYNDSNGIEPYRRPISLSRMSLSDIWRPATRKYCGNDFWKMLKTSVSILFSRSSLQEPAFQELILLYTEDMDEGETKDKAEVPLLQLKIYDKIPIPDLPVVFPHKKLSFRIIDTVRLDVASILGLLAYFINYKFENILSSPSAVLLDAVAVSALIIYVSRVALGYKQTWDRYQLLVNRTLYEKTLASGFGSVHFLLDASEQQQYKEAILAYAVLLKAENDQVHCRTSIGDKCERFIYDALKVKVKMPIDKAMDTLVRLGLVTETSSSERTRLQALPCTKAYEAIKQRWNSLLNQF